MLPTQPMTPRPKEKTMLSDSGGKRRRRSPTPEPKDSSGRLAHLGDASHFHDRRFSLPLCKAVGLVTIRIGAGKPLTVAVKDSHLPMMVLPAAVRPEVCATPRFHGGGILSRC